MSKADKMYKSNIICIRLKWPEYTEIKEFTTSSSLVIHTSTANVYTASV